MAQAAYWSISALILLAMPLSAWLWVRLIWRCGGSPENLSHTVPVRPRRRPFWTPADFLVMFGSFAVLTEVFRSAAVSKGWMPAPGQAPSQPTEAALLATVAVVAAAGVAALTITLTWLHLFRRDAWRDLGLAIGKDDVRLGLLGAVMILPPVVLISAAVSYFQPYHHPVLESLADAPTPLLFLSMFGSTALLTPLVEEFTFRVLLQGGLQSLFDREPNSDQWRPRSYWPVVITSVVFAGMHVGQGAAYIPLFFLSLGLGYLYRQIGKLGPPLIIHLLLNALTLCAEFSRIHAV